VVVEHLGPMDEAVVAVDAHGRHGETVAVGDALYEVRGVGLEQRPGIGLEGHELTSVVVGSAGLALSWVVGTRIGGPFRSNDGGRTFAPVAGFPQERVGQTLSVAFRVVGERGPGGAVVWGRTESGVLRRSDDLGATWSAPVLAEPVAALSVLPTGGVVAVCARRDRARVALSRDGGRAWAMREVPELRPGTVGDHPMYVAALDDVIAVTREGESGGPWLSIDGGDSWKRLPELACAGPLLLRTERTSSSPVLYAALFFDGADRGVVVRYDSSAARAELVLDVAEERRAREIAPRGDPEGDSRVLALANDSSRDGLWVATGAGLFRVALVHGASEVS
jgi:hypothetical protein